MNKPVVFAGSFDPVTNGHLDIIRRSRRIFGDVVVLIMPNKQKNPLFSLEERAELVRRALQDDMQNVRVEIAEGLLCDYLKRQGLSVVVRGIRNATDLDYEQRAEAYNKLFFPALETVYLSAKNEYAFISSSSVKEAFLYGGDISSLVPACVLESLRKK